MILATLLIIPFLAGILAWITGRFSNVLPRMISLLAILIDLVLVIILYGSPIADLQFPWIPILGISFHFMMDGLSLLMVTLTIILGLISVLISWKEIEEKSGFFYFNLMWILTGIMGVFMAADLFLFYFFWELMLVPMYFLIGIYGHGNKTYASNKFFLYTQASGLLMLLAILGLFFIHGRATGVYTFDYQKLLGTPMPYGISQLLMLGFLAAFLTKLPVVPLHNWLPDAHSEAPTAGSVILAGLMLKTGAYGIIRFAVPLFPDASASFAPVGMIIGVIGIIYGAHMALAQMDLKRLVAYTSVSHMGFVMVGIYALNMIAMQGVVVQMIAHALSTGALFVIAGQLQERLHTRDLLKMGGFWKDTPVLGAMALIFSLASLGLPGLANFVAEFMILNGAFQSNSIITVFASIGLIFATLYSLRIMKKIFYGPLQRTEPVKDLNRREIFVLGILVVLVVYVGVYPRHVLETSGKPVNSVIQIFNKPHPSANSQLIKPKP